MSELDKAKLALKPMFDDETLKKLEAFVRAVIQVEHKEMWAKQF